MANKTITLEPAAMYRYDEYDGWQVSSQVGGSTGSAAVFSGVNIETEKIVSISVDFTQTDSMGESGGPGTYTYNLGYGYGTTLSIPSSQTSFSIYMDYDLSSSFDAPVLPSDSIKDGWFIYIAKIWEKSRFADFIINYITITYRDENTVLYCANGEWVECVPYYGVNGSWVKCIPYYGSGGVWKSCDNS